MIMLEKSKKAGALSGFLSVLLTAALVIGLIPVITIPRASAAEASTSASELVVNDRTAGDTETEKATQDRQTSDVPTSDAQLSANQASETQTEPQPTTATENAVADSLALSPQNTPNVEGDTPAEAGISTFATLPVAKSGSYIGGASGDKLRLVYYSGTYNNSSGTYTVKVQRGTDNTYTNQYYDGDQTLTISNDGNASGAALRFTYNRTTYTYGTSYLVGTGVVLNATTPCATDGGFSSTVENGVIENGVISIKWNKVLIGSTGKTFDFELRYTYVPGSESFQRSYIITPNDVTLTDTKLSYGGDTFFAGSDRGTSWALWNNEVKMVYVKGSATTDTMSLSSSTASYYYAGDFFDGRFWASSFTESNTATNASLDNGYYLQWRPGTIAAGESSVQTATESFSGASTVMRFFPADNNPAKADASVGQILTFNFVLANVGTTTQTVTNIVPTSSSSAVTTTYTGDTSYELASNESVVVPVQVIVPKNTPVQTAQINLAATYGSGTGTAISTSASFQVENLAITLPSIVNIDTTTAPAQISYSTENATRTSVKGPDGSVVEATALGNDRYSFPALSDGVYTIYASDNNDRTSYETVDYKNLFPKHTVTYTAPDKTSGDVPVATTVYESAQIALSEPGNLAKGTAAFIGWKSGETLYQPGNTVKMGTTDMVFTAVWGSSVTYDYTTNGGTSSNAPTSSTLVAEGNSVNLNYMASRGTGYEFLGWNTDKAATAALTSLDASASSPLKLYALFKAKPAVAPTLTNTSGSEGVFGYASGALTTRVVATTIEGQSLSYQWYEVASGVSTPISGATASTWSVPTGKNAGSYQYRCEVTTTRADNGQTSSVWSDEVTVKVNQAASSLEFTCDNAIYTGGTVLAAQVTQNTSGAPVTFEYKLASEPDSAYSQTSPVATGLYTVRASTPATQNYKSASTTHDVSINYLALPDGVTPATAISTTGTRGNDGWYISDVVVKAAPGTAVANYKICSTLEGQFGSELSLTQEGANQGPASVYLMNAQGQKTDAIALATIKIDKTAPSGSVTVSTNTWDSFLQTITFGIYHATAQTATVAAEDVTSGISKKWYWVTDADYATVSALEANASFTEGASTTLVADSRNIVYAKIADVAGNLYYLRSDGIVIDSTAPTMKVGGVDLATTINEFIGGNRVVDVADANLDAVTLYASDTQAGLASATPEPQTINNGAAQVALTEKTTDTWYKIVAVDKAGNTTERTIKLTASVFAVTVQDVSLPQLTYGYAPTVPSSITIKNDSNVDIQIVGVTVDTSAFTISGNGSTVVAGASIDTWQIAAAPGLIAQASPYSAQITVTYN